MRVNVQVEVGDRDYEFEREDPVEPFDPSASSKRVLEIMDAVVADVRAVLGDE